MSIEITRNLEKAVVAILNFDDWQLEWTGDTNSLYDAEGLTPEKNGKRTRCVIEMKFRNKYYEKKLIEKIRNQNPTDISNDILPKLINRIQTIHTDDWFYDIGKVENLIKARKAYKLMTKSQS